MRSDRSRRRLLLGGLWLALAATLAGCQPGASKPPASPPLASTDPCAERLHEIGGALLLYYATNNRLPAQLADLPPAPVGAETPQTPACPVSSEPYIYNPDSLLRAPDDDGRIILYDARPAHSGMRWALAWDDPAADHAPRIARVVALPDSAFASPAQRP